MSNFRREWLFALLIAGICIILAFVDLTNIPKAHSGIHSRAEVIDVDNSQVRINLIVKTETQYLTVQLLNGPHKGHEFTIANLLSGKMEFDEFYEVNDVVLVEYDVVDGSPKHGMARGH